MSQVFYLPTRVFSGLDCVRTHAEVLKTLGKTALVVTGRQSAVATGAGADVAKALATQGIGLVLFDKIPPNPGFTEIRAAAALARDKEVDFVIGIGGGSPLDAAKAIAVLAANDLSDDALFQPPFAVAPLPVVAIPTTAGTGSEVTQYSILTNDKVQSKTSIAHESIFPRVAFLDPKYTLGLPRHVTVNTALDALSHLVEGFLAVRSTPLSQALALQGMALLGPALRTLAADPGLPSAAQRETLLLASTTAGMVIAHTGTTAGHALGYSLTYFKDIDHGRANALVMADLLTYLVPQHGEAVHRVLSALGYQDVTGLRGLLDALLGPRDKVTDAEIAQFAAIAVKAKNMGNTPVSPTEADLVKIYRNSLGR